MSSFLSESGLRPASAFLVVGAIVVTVAGKVVDETVSAEAAPPTREQTSTIDAPEFAIEDRHGVSLACSVPRFLVTGSARSLWHAHTPERIVEAIAGVIDDVEPEYLWERLMPTGSLPDGVELERDWILASSSEFLLSPMQAQTFSEWLTEEFQPDDPRVEGFRLLQLPRKDGQGFEFRVAWCPREVLSKRSRRAREVRSAWSWARRLGDELVEVLDGSAAPRGSNDEWVARRAAIWRALFPVDELLVLEDLRPDRVEALEAALRKEKVLSWQLGVSHDRVRSYAAGELEVVGQWGFTDRHNDAPIPLSGLERLAARMLTRDVWSFLERDGAQYHYRVDRAVRGGRANAYLSFDESAGPIVVASTIDANLQGFLEERLERLFEEHRPALSTAMVVDVANGEVLAIDSHAKYPTGFYPPVYYGFTPGSTFKALTMALAIERGEIHPDDTLDVGPGHWVVRDPENPRRRRTIREAKHAPTGEHTARHFFAKSVNAAFVQIGLRLEDADFRDFLVRLGYGRPLESGLGSEQTFRLESLPWDPIYTHASISFGHEVQTTLWQHATGLSTLLREGRVLPLTLIKGVRQGERFYEGIRREGERVLSPKTCATVMDLMREGVEYGTGRELAIDGVDMGSKTGTTHKTPGEPCAHVALAPGFKPPHFDLEGRERCNAVEKWMRQRAPHDTCYTSSIFLWGRRPEDGRLIAVLCVVDEVEDIEEYYGGKVAGPVARDVLVEALGLTRGGEPVVEMAATVIEHESSEPLASERNVESLPWLGEVR